MTDAPARRPRRKGAPVPVIGIVTVAVLLGEFTLYIALRPQAEHTSCTVSETVVFTRFLRRGSNRALRVESTCGTFTAPEDYESIIIEGSTYDFTARSWPWQTPYIIDARQVSRTP